MEDKGGSVGGEVRKIHIIYFLSRKGLIEHPHLIRVHHLSRTGVRLRDVKRWLSELRGKDMPEGFAWSYKRRYKAGYVWQDLLDEDLITPISDNEFVLKGSEISSITFTNDLIRSYGEKDDSKTKTSSPLIKVDIKDRKFPLVKESEENSINSSTKTSFEIEEPPSFGSETSFEDTTKRQEDYQLPTIQRQKKTEVSSFLETFLNKNKNDDKIKKETKSSKARPSFEKSSSYSGSGATHMFLNLITCGVVDTNDSAMTVIKRKDGTASMENVPSSNAKNIDQVAKFGGSERVSRSVHWTTLEKQRDTRKEGSKTSHNVSDSNNKKTIPTAYKFVNGPYCRQCGRQFNPEKLHTHMKSCRRTKTFSKAAKSMSEKLLDINKKDRAATDSLV